MKYEIFSVFITAKAATSYEPSKDLTVKGLSLSVSASSGDWHIVEEEDDGPPPLSAVTLLDRKVLTSYDSDDDDISNFDRVRLVRGLLLLMQAVYMCE